jgi:hypothetical protein
MGRPFFFLIDLGFQENQVIDNDIYFCYTFFYRTVFHKVELVQTM